MPRAKGGFYISFRSEPARRELFKELADTQGRFSVELSASDWQLEQKDMFVLSLSDEPTLLECAAVGRRKRGWHNSGASNIEFSGFVFFHPLDLSTLMEQLPSSVRSTIKDREGGRGKWFPPVAWDAFLNALRGQRPDVQSELDTLWDRVNAKDQLDESREVQRLAMQRDAIGLSLDIAGLPDIRRREFRKDHPSAEALEVQSFIELMDNQPPQERTLIEHDRSILEGIIARGETRDATFSKGPRTLWVRTVDKGRVERFAGVDLVILNRDFNSMLLLQYKCMEKEPKYQWRYRPDDQFHIELNRMEKVRALIEERTPPVLKLIDSRLNPGSLYFKFCKRLPLTQQDGELADGMMVSLPMTKKLLQLDLPQEQRHCRSIGYENCDRYLNNSLFSALARDGWIGSQGLTGQHYKEVLGFIQQNDNYSLVLAESRTTATQVPK